MPNLQPIIDRIAKAMDITKDLARQIVENYPNIVKEYQVYHVLDEIQGYVSIISTLSGIGVLYFIISMLMNKQLECDEKKEKNPFIKKIFWVFFISLSIEMILQIAKITLAPQMHFIMTQITKYQ